MTPDQQSSRIAVLLFTDMVDSVALEHKLGTDDYARLLRLHHQLFGRVLSLIGSGKIQLDTGDGFLAEFRTAAAAVNAALLFQMLLRETKWGVEAPKVRIGLHQGQLAEIQMDPASPGKIVGIPVSIASRVMSMARPSQILMTRSVFDDARQFVREHPMAEADGPKPPALKWKSHGSYTFKGTDAPIEVYEVGASGSAPLLAPTESAKARRTDLEKPETEKHPKMPRPWLSAGLTAALGLLLLTPVGDPWINASYDYLWRFGSHEVTNKVVLIQMDGDSYDRLHQDRNTVWDRGLHAQLLNKLAADGCPLVVMDIFFEQAQSNATDVALSEAMARCSNVVLMARESGGHAKGLEAATAVLPIEDFLSAAKTNWGAAYFEKDADEIVRRHWPFVSPGPHPSLSWTAAKLAGAQMSGAPTERWLRYYSAAGPWLPLGYYFALAQTNGFFRDTIVFIGNEPKSSHWGDGEKDKFRTPYSRWNGNDAVGGVELHATAFLNLLNNDWLRRLHWTLEAGLVLGLGMMAGYLLSRLSWVAACIAAACLLPISLLGGVFLTHYCNIWFPWLVFAGGQVPCALALALLPLPHRESKSAELENEPAKPLEAPTRTLTSAPLELAHATDPGVPEVLEYHLITPHFGEGGFGKVWLARNAIGQWQAIKAVYLSKFDNRAAPYEAEFNALTKYKPVSEKHPGLLRIELISRKKEAGYFYYVMELGDSHVAGWEQNPALYKPRDLETVRRVSPEGKLPCAQVFQLGEALCEALHFLHLAGLTHRDIKPSNIVFVKGAPKLADIGLVTNVRPQAMIRTFVGTAGFAPPHPEKPGTVQADIYALGVVLYVIATGYGPETFSNESSPPFKDDAAKPELRKLRSVILKACDLRLDHRFRNAHEMKVALAQPPPPQP